MTDGQLLNELIRIKVQEQTAIEKGASITEQEIYDQAKKDAESLKYDLNFYKSLLKAYNITEEEYIEHYMKDVKSRGLTNSIKNMFIKDLNIEVTNDNFE